MLAYFKKAVASIKKTRVKIFEVSMNEDDNLESHVTLK